MIPRPGLSQSSVIAAALIVAFVIFVTVRGELPYYIGVFTGKIPAPGGGGTTTAASPGLVTAAFPGSGPSVGISVGVGAGGINTGSPSPGGGGIFFPVGFQGGVASGGISGPIARGGFCSDYPELCDPNLLPPGGFGPSNNPFNF